VSIADAEHYMWGDGCDGWHLLQDPQLNVAQQFFRNAGDSAVEFLVISSPPTRGDRKNVV